MADTSAGDPASRFRSFFRIFTQRGGMTRR